LVKHKIYIDPNIPPIKQRYYPVSPATKMILHEQVEELLVKNLIRESESPSATSKIPLATIFMKI
ncbi:hypothetical protein, partial [Klebsiella pneumoniae]|uniref:hypothetical protein n=1 Tax=Klebsiella pneumoniae TaxID=573 RepID=UPI003013F6D0